MGKAKHLKILRKEARRQVKEALPAMLKPEPDGFFRKWIYRIAVMIVIAKPEK